MLDTAIVVHDPLGEFLDGTILHGPASVVRARDSGAMVLPFDVDRTREQLGGYIRCGWGGGWEVGGEGRICPMLIRVVPGRPWIYWAAWVVATGPNSGGSVRLIGDTGGPGIQAGSLSAVDGETATLDGRVQPSGIAIGGRRRVSVHEEGFIALNLFVLGRDVSVQVSAVTQSRIDVAYP
jgi:hypothetical protein